MKKKLIFLMILTILSVNCIPVLAADNGEGKAVGLALAESNPENGAVDVPLDTQIKLLFNKNVVNLTVKDNNSKCFRLLDADNNEVPIEVIFPDDQIEPERKREINLKPLEQLKENTTYKVEVSEMLQAKNGTNLGTAVSITFTTIALQPSVQKPEAAQAVSKETAVADTAESQAVEAAAEASDKSDTVEVAVTVENTKIPESAETADVTGSPEITAVPEIAPAEAAEENAAAQYLWVAVIAVAAIAAIILALKKRKP